VSVGPLRAAITADPVTRASTVSDGRERLVFTLRHLWSGPHRFDDDDRVRPDASAGAGEPSRFAEPPP
jgi:hypothetical protein